jgi:AcrR family transcriptional regulator
MKSKQTTDGPRDRTRRVILEAMADVISDTNGIGFSVQAVADKAGVTHRTIYNHFPTREALCEGFSAYVDEQLISIGGTVPSQLPLEGLAELTSDLYKTLGMRERHARAYVMLMMGNRQPLQTWRRRSLAIEREIAQVAGPDAPIPPKLVAAAVRMFVSTMGWHLLTEQCGLTTDEAAATSKWATQALLDAAIGPEPSTPRSTRPSRSSKRGPDAIRRR